MCDTFVVVDPAGVLFAKNSDRDPNEAQVLAWQPAADHPGDSELRCTHVSIPQARRTHAVVLSRPFWMWGAEMGANEHGVAIGNEAVFTDAPFEPGGLLGMDLVRLGLERGASAAEAVEVIAALIHRHGQGGRCGYSSARFRYHNSFLIADAREAWLLETAGRECARERITHGVRAISNGLTLPALLPRSRRLHTRIAAATARRTRVECLAAGVHDAAGAARVLADHGEHDWPCFDWHNGAMRTACVHAGGLLASSQTVGSWISELRPDGALHWATGASAPCMSLFRPLSVWRARDTGKPTGTPDPLSLWWRQERINRHWLGAHAAPPAAWQEDHARTQAAIFASPAIGWELAEDFLERWDRIVASANLDQRPWWLKRVWAGIGREAGASRLPWREA